MLDTGVNKLRSYRKYQETYRELSRLSTRELADLGISRGEISNVARKAKIRACLNNSLGFGGHNVCLVIDAAEG